jgi:predicted phosphodiesterase
MQRIVCDLPKSFELISGSCTHIGSIMCHEAGIEKVVDYVGSGKNRFFIHLGDWIEYIPSDDIKRFNPAPQEHKLKEIISPTEQAKQAAKMFMPIKDKILCGLLGNHERKYSRYGDLVKDIICSDLDIPYATSICRIIIKNNKKNLFNIQAMHGKRIFKSNAKDYEQREGNKKAALKLYLQNQMGDCAIQLCGHAHWIGIVPPSNIPYFVDGEKGVKHHYLKGMTHAGYIPPDQRWYACCGSARKSRLDGYDDYAQEYEPTDLGFVKIIVDNGEIVKLEPFLI